MPLLVLEPIGGIAGDMFLAAAIDLGVPPAALEASLRTLEVTGWRLEVTRKTDSGISGTHVEVVVETPVNLTKRQQELLREFEQAGTAKDQSPQSEGFFSKVRELWADLRD